MNLLVCPNYLNSGNLALAQKKVYDEAGCNCIPYTRKNLLNPRVKYDCAVLDWFDEVPARNPFRRTLAFLYSCLAIIVLRIRGVKIVYVVDRKQSLRNGLCWQFVALRRFIVRFSSAIVCCCEEAVDVLREQVSERRFAKVQNQISTIVVPPLYIDEEIYAANGTNYRDEFGFDDETFVFLSIGTILPSKNYDAILDVAKRFQTEKRNAAFLILGQTEDKAYLRHITARADDLSNVVVTTRYINQNELIDFTRSFDAALIAHDTESFLASAALCANCQIGINVVTSKFGVLDMLPNGLVYSFDSRADRGLADRIYRSASRAYKDWLEDPSAFADRAERLQEYVLANWSVSSLGKQWRDVFRKLR